MLGEIYLERMGAINVEPCLQNHILMESSSCLSGNLKHVDFDADRCVSGCPIFQGRNISSEERDSIGFGISKNSGLIPAHASDKTELVEVASAMQNAGVSVSFQDGHCNCKAQELDGSDVLTEVVTDEVDSSSSHHEREQLKEDGENGEMLGGIFAFSEEGKI